MRELLSIFVKCVFEGSCFPKQSWTSFMYYIQQKEAGYSASFSWPSCVIIKELQQSEPLT